MLGFQIVNLRFLGPWNEGPRNVAAAFPSLTRACATLQGDSLFVTVSFAPIEHMRYNATVPVYLDGNLAKV